MADIATISLKVNTSDVECGSNELDKFKEAAAGAAKGADNFGDSGKSLQRLQLKLPEKLRTLINAFVNSLKL